MLPGSTAPAASARASRQRHDAFIVAAASSPSPTARAAAGSAAAGAATAGPPPVLPVLLSARLAALGRRVRVACAYKPEDAREGCGEGKARAARLLSAPGATVYRSPDAAADADAATAATTATTTPPSSLLAQLHRLLPPSPSDEDDNNNSILSLYDPLLQHANYNQQQQIEPLLDRALAAWRGGVRRSPPLTPREADGAALAAADLLRACAALRLHPRRDPRAARCLELATHAVASRACSPAPVAAALAAWGGVFAAAGAARPTTPIRPFFGVLAEPGACRGLTDAALVRVVAAMARLPARRGALEAVGLELQRRMEEEQEGGAAVGRSPPPMVLLLLSWLPQLLRRGLPPSCAAALLRAASASAEQARPQDAWALLLALRPLVPGEVAAAAAGGDRGREGEAQEAQEAQEGAVATASAAAEEAAPLPLPPREDHQQERDPSPAAHLLPRPQWTPPPPFAANAAARDDGDIDTALAAAVALLPATSHHHLPQPPPTTMDDVRALAEDLARRLALRARRAPPPLRAAPPLPAGLEAALAEKLAADSAGSSNSNSGDDPRERHEAALRAAEDILSARLDQLAAALPLCEAAPQVLAACEGAVRALAPPALAAAAARSPRCRASAAALLRALEAAAFCEAAGALDLAQRLLLLRSLDALRWAANADVHVNGSVAVGVAVGGGGATVPPRDDAFSAALRRDLGRELAAEAPLGAVASALRALAALRLPPPAVLPAVASSPALDEEGEEDGDGGVGVGVGAQQPQPQQQPGWDSVALLRLLVARARALPLSSSAPLLQAMAALGYEPPRAALEYFLEPLLRDRHQHPAFAAAASSFAAGGAPPAAAAPRLPPSLSASEGETALSSGPPSGALDALFALGGTAPAAAAAATAPAADAEAAHRLLLALGRFAENERGRRRRAEAAEAGSTSSSSAPPEPPLVSRRALKRVLLAHAAAAAPRLGPRALLAAGRAARLAAAPFYPSTPGDVWATAWARRLRACATAGQLSSAEAAEAALLLARLDWSPQPGGDGAGAAATPRPRRSLAWERALWEALEPSRRAGWGPALAAIVRARLEPLQRDRLAWQQQQQQGRRKKRSGGGLPPPTREAEAERRALLWAALKHSLGPATARPEWTRAFVALAARAGPDVAPHVAAAVLAAFARGTFAGLRRERTRRRRQAAAAEEEEVPVGVASPPLERQQDEQPLSPPELARLRRHVAVLAAAVAEGAGLLGGSELVRTLRALRAAEAALGALSSSSSDSSPSFGGDQAASSALAPMPLERRRAVLSAALVQARRATNPPPAAAAALLDLLAAGPLRPVALMPAARGGGGQDGRDAQQQDDEDEDARLARRADASLARAWVNHLCALAVGPAEAKSEQRRREEEEEDDDEAAAGATPFFPPWAPQSRRWKRAPTAAALLRALRASPELAQALVDGGAPPPPSDGRDDADADGGRRRVRWGAALLLASAADEPSAAAAAGLSLPSSSPVASDLSAAVTSAAFLLAAGLRRRGLEDEDEEEEQHEGRSLASVVVSALASSSSPPSQQQLRPRDALALLPPSAILAAAEAAPIDGAEMLAAMAELAGATTPLAAALAAAAPLAAFGRRAASWALLRALSAPLGRVGRAAASSAAAASRGRAAFERAVVDGTMAGAAGGLFAQQQQDEQAAGAALWAEASRAALELRLARLLREAVAASSSRLASSSFYVAEAEDVAEEEEEEEEGSAAAAEDDAALLRVFALGNNGSSLVRALDLRMASLARRAIKSPVP